MDDHASFTGVLDAGTDVYAEVMQKEHKVLDLIHRVDDTRREELIRRADTLMPMLNAFVGGMGSFVRRLSYYAQNGQNENARGLLFSDDGLVYGGVALVAFTILLVLFVRW